MRVLFKSVDGEFEGPPRKESEIIMKMTINRLLVQRFHFSSLVAVTICQHKYFVEGSINEIHTKVCFCGFYNHYRDCVAK